MTQINNPLHGKTLKLIITELQQHFGWEALAKAVPIRCFSHDPSIKSSLTFLRRTPWARTKIEELYLEMLDKQLNSVDPWANARSQFEPTKKD